MRYIHDHILQDLERKMVFIGGPRQVGKTTLAQHILDTAGFSGRYFDWDYDRDRFDRVIKAETPAFSGESGLE
jgi:predicted AAA+ superfamily ATPase